MVMLEVTEKILKTSIEVMAVELELSRAMKKRIGNALFKKRASHLVWSIENSGQFVRRNRRKFLKNAVVLPWEEYITRTKSLVCNIKVRKVNDARRKFVPRGKT